MFVLTVYILLLLKCCMISIVLHFGHDLYNSTGEAGLQHCTISNDLILQKNEAELTVTVLSAPRKMFRCFAH